MKLTNSDLIRNREKELLETISGDLNRDSIRKLLVAKYGMDLDRDSLLCRDGDLVVHENQVVYQLNFEVMMNLSLLFNRQGECLDIIPSAEDEATDKGMEIPDSGAYAAVATEDPADKGENPDNDGSPEGEADEDNSAAGRASTIADMISEINKS